MGHVGLVHVQCSAEEWITEVGRQGYDKRPCGIISACPGITYLGGTGRAEGGAEGGATGVAGRVGRGGAAQQAHGRAQQQLLLLRQLPDGHHGCRAPARACACGKLSQRAEKAWLWLLESELRGEFACCTAFGSGCMPSRAPWECA